MVPAGEEQLVDAYVRGQVSRRTFIRRLVTVGVGLTVASTYADLLRVAPAQASSADCMSDYYDHSTAPGPVIQVPFHGTQVRVAQGGTVQWRFGYAQRAHWIRDHTGMQQYSSGPRYFCDTFEHTFVGAGLHTFICADAPHNHWPQGNPTGTVNVPLKFPVAGTLGVPTRITWASVAPAAGLVHDVQVREPGATTWTWLWQGTTTRRGDYTPTWTGDHLIRARVRRPGSGQTGWVRRTLRVT